MDKKEVNELIRNNAPCYIYEKETIKNNCKKLNDTFKNVKFLYSIKANPYMPVIKEIANEGIGSDAASSNEVLMSFDSGILKEEIYYSAPGKTKEDLLKAWDKCTFIADSLHELELLDELSKEKNLKLGIGVRINPNYSIFNDSISSSKFGIDEDLLTKNEWKYENLNIIGIHVHLQSQLLDKDALSNYYKNTYNLAKRIAKIPGAKIDFINFGSGIGVVYDKNTQKPMDIEFLSRTIEDLQEMNKKELKAKFMIETGRYLVMNSGTYYTPVIDKKVSNGKTFLIVKNALNGFLKAGIAELLKQLVDKYPEKGFEPLYTGPNQCEFNVVGKEKDLEKVDIGGTLCTALDVLARDVEIPKAEIGDIISVSNAGSYAYSLSIFEFASHDKPKEFLV